MKPGNSEFIFLITILIEAESTCVLRSLGTRMFTIISLTLKLDIKAAAAMVKPDNVKR